MRDVIAAIIDGTLVDGTVIRPMAIVVWMGSLLVSSSLSLIVRSLVSCLSMSVSSGISMDGLLDVILIESSVLHPALGSMQPGGTSLHGKPSSESKP